MTNLYKRTLTAGVLAVVGGGALWLGGVALVGLLAVAFGFMLVEWRKLGKGRLFFAGGVFYLAFACFALVYLRAHAGFTPLVWLLGIIIVTDTGAYICGHLFGKRKLAPKISPHKTVEGALGGTVLAVLFAHISAPYLLVDIPLLALMPVTLSLIAQAGDLFISHLKRQVNVKDTGHYLPGHGGLLDRFDSYLPTVIVFAVFFILI